MLHLGLVCINHPLHLVIFELGMLSNQGRYWHLGCIVNCFLYGSYICHCLLKVIILFPTTWYSVNSLFSLISCSYDQFSPWKLFIINQKDRIWSCSLHYLNHPALVIHVRVLNLCVLTWNLYLPTPIFLGSPRFHHGDRDVHFTL